MDENKIEEMRQVIQNASCKGIECEKCFLENSPTCVCVKALYNAGYRKESDTAREILDEAKKWVKAHYKDKVTDSFGEREMLFMEAFGCLFEYLKEKYEVK